MPRLAVVICGLLIFSFAAAAAMVPEVPPLSGRVVDLTGTLDDGQQQAIGRRLQTLEQAKGSQLAVLIIPTTGADSIEQYSIRVAETWKLGRPGVDDGAVLVVAKNDRVMRIEVGYGLEGALNDATCKRIISEIIVPKFQHGDFYGGVDAGVQAMVGVVSGEPLPAPVADSAGSGRLWLPALVLVFAIAGLGLRAWIGRLPAAVVCASAAGAAAWAISGMIGTALGFAAMVFFVVGIGISARAGRWFGGGPGGSSGGGFRGGGGNFGGGGASGRW